ncbi:MAG: hypothetical protein AB1505_14835 [Candidatus Latescibacterota bacterium]
MEYSVAAGRGRMLFCGPGSQTPPVRLPLPVQGWHHLFVATYRSPQYPGACLRLKLGSDASWTRAAAEDFRPEKDLVDRRMFPGPADLCEAYWKSVDLPPGEEVLFHRPVAGSMADTVANVAYLRLVPLSAAEREWLARERRPDTRRLIANYDGGQHPLWAYASAAEVQEEMHALADSDFGMVVWGAAYSLAAFYPSRVASPALWAADMPGAAAHGCRAEERRREHAFDPLRAAACYAAGVDGLCFWDCQGRAPRLSGWAVHRLLGHRDELQALGRWAEALFRCVPMETLDGFVMGTEFSLPTDG